MAFLYRLEREDGTPADPPTLRTAVSVWAPDTIPLGRDRPLRVIDVQPGNDPDGDPERTTCGSSHTRSSFVPRRPAPRLSRRWVDDVPESRRIRRDNRTSPVRVGLTLAQARTPTLANATGSRPIRR